MAWRDITVLPCGCKLQQLYAPSDEMHHQVCVHPVGSCTTHLCRVCGDVPLADAEPDRLCQGCWLADRRITEGWLADRRVTVSVEDFRTRPDEIAQLALTKEVEIVIDGDTRIYCARRLPPLGP